MTARPAPFVFFDVGGTLLVPGTELEEMVETVLFAHRLVRAGDAVRAAVAAAVAAHEGAGADGGERDRPAAGRRELYARVFRELALEERADSLAGAVWEMSFDLAPPVLAPGASAALELLRGAGARMGVISNWDDSLDVVLARAGVRPYLEVVVTSMRAGWSKPNRRIFEAALAGPGSAPATPGTSATTSTPTRRGRSAPGCAPSWWTGGPAPPTAYPPGRCAPRAWTRPRT